MLEVIAIEKHNPDSWNDVPRIVAVAVDEEAAHDWTNVETRKPQYAQGHDAVWWIEHRQFKLKSMVVWEKNTY